jgi:triosephosphate isomerase
MHWELSGAYTGEISATMLAEICSYVIIGHSERRAYFDETDETVNHKVQVALAHNLTPIVCVGETLEENEGGKTSEVVSRQIKSGLGRLDLGDFNVLGKVAPVVIAYEPVWAIGTGRAATADGANAVIADFIRPALGDLYGDDFAQSVRVLYGGSVKGDNAAEFFAQPDIDGALVGGASLKAADFTAIVQAASV